jgi:hypothetical protein
MATVNKHINIAWESYSSNLEKSGCFVLNYIELLVALWANSSYLSLLGSNSSPFITSIINDIYIDTFIFYFITYFLNDRKLLKLRLYYFNTYLQSYLIKDRVGHSWTRTMFLTLCIIHLDTYITINWLLYRSCFFLSRLPLIY